MRASAAHSGLFAAALAVCVGCHTDGQCTKQALAGGKLPPALAGLVREIDTGTVKGDLCKTRGAKQIDGQQWTIMFRRGVLRCTGASCSAPDIRGIGIRVVGAEPRLHVANVVLTPNQIGPLVADDRVRFIEPNCSAFPMAPPPGPETPEVAALAPEEGCESDDSEPWGMADACVPRLSQPDRTGSAVAVLDSGLDCLNPAIHERIDDGKEPMPPRRCTQDSGRNYLYPELPPDNCDNAQSPDCSVTHGLQVAGVVASNAANLPGVDPAAKLVSMRILKGNSDTDFVEPMTKVATAILDSGGRRSRIINISANWYTNHPWLAAAIDAVTADGMHLVVASAREGDGSPAYPAAFTTCNDAVIGVSGIWKQQQAEWWRYRWINWTEHNEEYLAAPGGVIPLLDPNEPNGTLDNGTSFAAPHVTGAASLVWSTKEFEHCNAAGVRELLECSARISSIGKTDPVQRKRLHLGCLFSQRDSPICRGARRCIESVKKQYCP